MTIAVNLPALILAGLATARITSLIVHDSILEGVRHRIFQLSPPPDDIENGFGYQQVTWRGHRRNGRVPRRPGFVGSLLSCTHCVGVWVAAAALAALHWYHDPALAVLTVAAVSQVAEATIKASR